MTHMTDERQTNTAGMVLLAALAGAAAALLFAPKKGTETREDIKTRYNDMMTKTQSKVQDTQSKMAQTVSQASDKVKSAADRAAEKTKSVASQTADQTKSVADQADDTTQKTKTTRRSSGTLIEDDTDTLDTDLRTRL